MKYNSLVFLYKLDDNIIYSDPFRSCIHYNIEENMTTKKTQKENFDM